MENYSDKGFKIIAYISDIHIGNKNISAETMKSMLIKNFIQPLKKLRHLDAVMVCGDVSHSILSLNTDYGRLYKWFFNELCNVAKYRMKKYSNKSIVIGILEGTMSHDMDHLSFIEDLQDNEDGVDFRIYRDFESTYLFEDYKMLVLPDKRVNKHTKKKLQELLEEEYDLIVGHGSVDTLKFRAQESENLSTEAYHFSLKKLMNISRGPVVFGHYHSYVNVKDKFFYCSSFTKLERCDGQHGFLIAGIYDKDHTKFKVDRYINDESIDYHEIEISEDELKEYDAITIISAVKSEIMSMNKNDLFTIRIRIENNTYITDKVYMIDDAFRTYPNVSIVKKLVNKVAEAKSSGIKNKKKRLFYLFDKNMSTEEAIVKYYNEEIRPSNAKYKDIELDIKMVGMLINGS